MFHNAPSRNPSMFRRFATSLVGALTFTGLAASAALIGLAFIILLPVIGPLLLGALMVSGACDAACAALRDPRAAQGPSGVQFAH